MRPFNRALLVVSAISIAEITALVAAQGQAASVKDLFEKYNLVGTFAMDCSKLASASNYYYVNRVIDPGHVQRDRMTGPETRDYVTIIDHAIALGPNEIEIGGTRTEGRFNGQSIEETWRVEANRQMAIEASVGSNKVITGGRLNGGQAVWWANRCPGP